MSFIYLIIGMMVAGLLLWITKDNPYNGGDFKDPTIKCLNGIGLFIMTIPVWPIAIIIIVLILIFDKRFK